MGLKSYKPTSAGRRLMTVSDFAEITRAGIFRVSFVLPAGFEVESISGPSLSHWTELKAETGRIITLQKSDRSHVVL